MKTRGLRLPGHYLPVLGAFLLSALLAGCAVGPDYMPPKAETPEGWHNPPDPALVPEAAAIREWWTVFNDPLLTQLVKDAIEDNRDLKVAVARVKEARAQLGVAVGEWFPQADAYGDVERSRKSDNALMAVGTNTTYSLGIASNWEIDVFGRISRSVESATAHYEASEEDRNDVLVSLCAEVARTYLAVRTLQTRLEASRGNIESQKQVVQLTQTRFKFGLATDLDVAQAQQVLATSESELPSLRKGITEAINTLAVLLGRPPGALTETLSAPAPIPMLPDQVAVGVPADLLRRRPDVRRVERELAAQTARIGVATADLYPQFTLSGSFGWAALASGDVFLKGSREWDLFPGVRWNVFDAGRIRNQIKVEDARTEQALLGYEQTILVALKEVENALNAYAEERLRVQSLEDAVTAAQRALYLATALYKEGLVDFQNVLDAQRSLFVLENLLAEGRGATAADLVDLYRALGGGWEEVPSPPNQAGPSGPGDSTEAPPAS
jgi:outer membrane protein, multidrug efflux system